MERKIESAKALVEFAVEKYPRIGVACSFGKDSMVVVSIAREVAPDIEVFSIMTPYKPKETFEYLKLMDRKMKLNTVVYIVAESIPEVFSGGSVDVRLLPPDEFQKASTRVLVESGKEIYAVNPDECCRLLKVEPTRVAVSSLDAWICGLRKTEGRTREDYQEIEHKNGLAKINPILTFTEAEVWRYLSTRGIEPHPWYGKGYRSLGCAPCSHPGGELERDGRWLNTSKCGGECGIHTKALR
ncbi:MAG: phosphoadenosine phosphosulfate reductase family protein [Dehalococcoidia bacterium]|nr:phosphoadenosine phosphosulfate reductase family protein [Dehalococcoidia bacterium]